MSGLALTTLANVAKRLYAKGTLEKLWDVNTDGLAATFKSKARGIPIGGQDTQFMIDLAPPGAVANIGETGNFYGRDSGAEEAISSSVYDRVIIKRRYIFGIIQASIVSLMEAEQNNAVQRFQLQAFTNDVIGIMRAMALHYYYTLHTGSQGYLWKCAQTGAITNEALVDSQYEYTVTIDQEGDSRFIHSAEAIHSNQPVQLRLISTGAVVSQTGAIEGIVKANLGPNQFKLRLNLNRRITSTAAINDNHCFTLFRRASTSEAYGFEDMINDGTADFGGAGPTFPYGTGETGISPANVGEWAAARVDGSGSVSSIRVMDDLFSAMWYKGGVQLGMMNDVQVCTSLDQLQQMTLEAQNFFRYAPRDRQDLRPQSYYVYHNGAQFKPTRCMPFGTAFAYDMGVMATDELGNRGPMWARLPQTSGGPESGGYNDFDGSSPVVRAVAVHPAQRFITNRRRTGRAVNMPRPNA